MPRSTGCSRPRPTGTGSTGAGTTAPSAARAPRRHRAPPRRSTSPSSRARTTRTGSTARTPTWPRRTSSWSCTSATTSTRDPASAPTAYATTCPRPSSSASSDYRTRHAQYKTDPDLQAAHAAFPFLMTWDDHEFKDNYADLDLESCRGAARDGRRAARGGVPGLLGALAAAARPQADRQGHAAVPAPAVGRAGDLPRARHAPVPLRPDRAVHAGAARPGLALLPDGAGADPRHPRRRAARLAAPGPGRSGRRRGT